MNGSRALRWIVGVALVVAAGCVLLVAQAQGDTAALVRHLGVAGRGRFGGSAEVGEAGGGSVVFAILAVLVGVSILGTGSRTLHGIAFVVAMLLTGAGAWLAMSSEPMLWSGGLLGLVPREVVAGVLIFSSIAAGAASVVAFRRLPGLPDPTRPHMPPPTHLGG
jgi:hypothetical protein